MKIGKSWLVLLIAAALTIIATALFHYWGLLVMLILLVAAAVCYLYPAMLCISAGKKVQAGDDENALVQFEKANHCRWATPTVRLTYAYELIRTSRVRDAEFVLNDLLNQQKKMSPKELWMTKQNLSLVMYKTERFSEAEALMEEVFAENKTTSTYGTLGYYKILADGCERALGFCREAYDFNDEDPVIADNLLTAYIGLSRYEEAKKVTDAIMAQPKHRLLELYYHAAQTEAALGNIDKAESYLEVAKKQKRSFLTTVSEEEMTDLTEAIRQQKNQQQ